MDAKKIEELKSKAYSTAVEHGWYEKGMTEKSEIMLIVTELSEAVNADRKGKYADRILFEKSFDTPQQNPESYFMFCYEFLIKDMVEDELADAFIRILSYCANWDIELEHSYFKDEYIDIMKDFMKDDIGFAERIYSIVFTVMQYNDCSLALVRLMALAKINGIDLLWYIEQKMKYNSMRPYKHGKKY